MPKPEDITSIIVAEHYYDEYQVGSIFTGIGSAALAVLATQIESGVESTALGFVSGISAVAALHLGRKSLAYARRIPELLDVD